MRQFAMPVFLLCAPVFAAAACGSSSESSVTSGPTARFALAGDAVPAFLDVPFPSDAYIANGKIVDPIPGLDKMFKQNSQFFTHELGKLNGFSRIAMSLFYVDDTTGEKDDNGNYP